MGNEVGRQPERAGRDLNLLPESAGALGPGGVVVGAGDGERRRFRDLYMLQDRIGE